MGRNNQQRRAARARERAKARSGQRAGAPAGSWMPGAGFGSSYGPAGSEPAWAAEGSFAAAAPPPPPPPSPRGHVRAAIDAAMQVAQFGAPVSGSAAFDRLCARGASESGRRLVAGTVVELLAAEVDWVWQHGWQPADLLRVAGRRLHAPGPDVVGDAIAHELGRYAAVTIAPRWPGQLREHEVSIWWSRDSDHLSARASRTPGGFPAVLAAALEALSLLRRLPGLEAIDPLPGSAQPRRSGPAIDDRILSRVRAFLAKAEATPYEAEAETFTAAAQQLMARHSIDAAMLAATAPGGDGAIAIRIGIDRPYEAPKVALLNAVADANRCRTVWSEALGFVTVVGFEGDLLAVETLFTSLLVQATTALAEHGRQVGVQGTSRTRSFRNAFLTAFAYRIGQRLAEVTAAETAAAQERARAEAGLPSRADGADAGGVRPAGPGRDVVLVLNERREEVDAALHELFPSVVLRRSSRPTNAAGWTAGVRAADQAKLFAGAQVER